MVFVDKNTGLNARVCYLSLAQIFQSLTNFGVYRLISAVNLNAV